MFFLPTRGRPDKLRTVLNACVATRMANKLIVIVDGKYGTDAVGVYMDMANEKWPENIGFLFTGTDVKLGPTMNLVLERFPDEQWYGFITDTHIPETGEWDQKLVAELFATDSWIVSSNDGWQAPTRMHGAAVFRGDIVRKLGYFAPADMNHMFIDDVWETIGRDSGKWKVMMDVMVRHIHQLNSTMKEDDVATAAMSYMEHDRNIFQRWMTQHYSAVREVLGYTPNESLIITEEPKELEVTFIGKKLFIATPSHDGRADMAHVAGLLDLYGKSVQYGFSFRHGSICFDSMLPRARNELVYKFLDETEHDYMLFIDSDIAFTGDDVMRLMAYAQMGYDVIGAAGPARRHKGKYCAYFSSDVIDFAPGTDICEALGVGTGFLLITRKCLLAMTEKYGRFIDPHSGKKIPQLFEYQYFSPDGKPDNRTIRGEDYTFCAKWRAMGGKVYVHPFIRLKHLGPEIWEGCIGDTIMAALNVERNKQHELLQDRHVTSDGGDGSSKVRAAGN